MSTKDGIKSALDEAMASENSAPEPMIEQLPLLPLPPVAVETGAERESNPKGVGRPKGARNKRTQEWADFILGRYRSPLIVMAEIYSRPVEELAHETGLKRSEAIALQLRAAEALAPYVHQKLPTAIDLDAKGIVELNIGVDTQLVQMIERAQEEQNIIIVENDDKSNA